MENWKDISGYEGHYQISDLGRVKSLKHNKEKILNLGYDGDGYLLTSLSINNIRKTYRVNVLVGKTFISNPNNLPVVMHKNDIKSDNRVENLEWGTHQKNIQDAYDRGLKKPHSKGGAKGINNSHSKLNDIKVRVMKRLLEMGEKPAFLIKVFNVKKAAISKIKSGITWKHLN